MLIFIILFIVQGQGDEYFNCTITNDNNTTSYQDCTNLKLNENYSVENLNVTCPLISGFVKLNIQDTFTVTGLMYTNCSQIVINSTNTIINQFLAIGQQYFKRPLIVEQNYLKLNATNKVSLISNFTSENYSLIVTTASLNISPVFNFYGLKLIVITQVDIELHQTQISVNAISCNNTLGFESMSTKSRKDIEDRLVELYRAYFNNDTRQEVVNELVEILPFSNYTLVLATRGQLNLQNTNIIGSQLGLYAKDIVIDAGSTVDASGMGCQLNQGNGRGPTFFATQIACYGNGGSNGGYGGVGLWQTDNNIFTYNKENYQCLQLANATRFMFNLYPYNYLRDPIYQGSGGGILQQNPQQNVAQGGGSIVIHALKTLMLDGRVTANGKVGVSSDGADITQFSVISGAGSGGSITIKYAQIYGSISSFITVNGGNSLIDQAGEGGGGIIKIRQYVDWAKTRSINVMNQSRYDGHIEFNKGYRNLSIKNTEMYLAQNGTLFEIWCPPYQETSKKLKCVNCRLNYYKIWWGGQCVPCPSDMTETTKEISYEINQDKTSTTFCPDSQICKTSKCVSYTATTHLFRNTSIQLAFFFGLILIGYLIRRSYKQRDSSNEKNFDFENATRDIVAEKIITESLQETNTFQFGDLMYHAHRINVIGNNTYNSPWVLYSEPPVEIANAVLKEDYGKFAMKFNKIAAYSKSQHIIQNMLSIIYYPLYWWIQTKHKKSKYKAIVNFITRNEIYKFWKGTPQDQSFMRMKLTKSADYTLLYIDVFNYKNSDLKYIFLSCPFIIYLSGEGNFLRPYYLCESDQFLVSLFFAINKNQNMEGNRFKILDNLVSKQKREENSKEIRRFLKKFNKIAMTLDYGALSSVFVDNFKLLFMMIDKWNQQFFSQYNVKLELFIMQVPFETTYSSQIITIVELKSEPKFRKFMKDIHRCINYNKLQDVKFGIFIFNTEQDAEDIDEAFNTQKFSFYENEDMTIMQEIDLDDSNFDMNQLKEQFLAKNTNKELQTAQHVKHQFKQLSEKMNVKPNKCSKVIHILIRMLSYLRFQAFSHKFTILDKYTLIIMLCILILLDNFALQQIIIILYEFFRYEWKFGKWEMQIIIFPYPFAFIASNVMGSIWMPSQSYGLLKIYLIFNSMAIVVYLLNLLISLISNEENNLLDVFVVTSLFLKIIIGQLGERLISMNVKLNQLSSNKIN